MYELLFWNCLRNPDYSIGRIDPRPETTVTIFRYPWFHLLGQHPRSSINTPSSYAFSRCRRRARRRLRPANTTVTATVPARVPARRCSCRRAWTNRKSPDWPRRRKNWCKGCRSTSPKRRRRNGRQTRNSRWDSTACNKQQGSRI